MTENENFGNVDEEVHVMAMTPEDESKEEGS